ncbi:hypothetical protein LTR10_018420 [Elasticomyces elasticus]|nr:hypothetical protein LTR10_018420 [Elasticomyces elasticus]KAK5036783.1 hypothetical protein LTR13_005163 [Exophiala sideris]
MTIHKHNHWDTRPDVSCLVPLPSRNLSLFAHASGPARRPGDPLVIFFTGAGGPAASYIKVQQHLSRFVRTLFFDRAGYDLSTLPQDGQDDSSTPLTAQNGAKDLDALLQTLDLAPPYILAGHSFGGIPLREFMHLKLQGAKSTGVTDIIAGIVLYDTGAELAFDLYPRIPSAELVVISEDVDWVALTHLREQSGMTDDEWNYIPGAMERTYRKLEVRKEDTHGSAHCLALKRQLECHAYDGGILSVLLYDEGIRLGAGTDEQRAKAREFIQSWSLFNCQIVRAQMDLVGEKGPVKYTYHDDWGHDSPVREPALVGEQVRWVMQELEKRKDKQSHQQGP